MAAIGESTTLCMHVDEKELISVTDGGSENEIVLTMRSTNVSSYNVSSQKPIKSWSVPRMLKLQSPTIWNSKSDAYITVSNQQEVRNWSKTDQNIEKAHKKRFKFSLHKVLNVDGYEPIVVCQNGAVGFLSDLDTSSPPEGHLHGDDEILLCEAYRISEDICMACLVKRKNSETLLLLSTYKSDQWTYNTSRLDEDRNGLVYDFVCQGPVIRTLILDPDGRLCSIDYDTETNGQTYRYLCTLPGVTANTKMVALNWSHIAIGGLMKDKQECVGIFNVKFGTLQDWKPLPEQGKSGLKLFALHKHLIVLSGRCVYCFSYDCTTSSIDSILGNLSSTEVKTPSSSGPVSWSRTSSIKHTDTDVHELFTQLVTQASNRKKKLFTDLVDKYLSFADKEGHNTVSMSTYTGQIVDLCLSTEGFWPRDVVRNLINRGAIPHSKLQRLFDCLMSHSETEMILRTLTVMKELPEVCICKCLEFILSCEDSQLENAINSLNLTEKTAHTTDDCPLCWTKTYFLYPYLINIELLKYLNYILNEGKQSNPAAATLPYVKVVDWICHIVDSHVTQLIISPDARQILLDLHDVVQSQLQLYEELVILDTLLAQLKEKSTIPRSKKVGQYCIEVLHIL
ncbi:hypothetical protein FSP39_017704 [Pinctada imbricata]|uniref:Nucleolar protein 11 n=1 Tax=Pinctada imbricata TaxID=66713 RepID=A0AA88XRT6_PINIB|nr:hypothetical protein FSP39_017704 [Pinctada imbricata]